jgi:hypothetical protein
MINWLLTKSNRKKAFKNTYIPQFMNAFSEAEVIVTKCPDTPI